MSQKPLPAPSRWEGIAPANTLKFPPLLVLSPTSRHASKPYSIPVLNAVGDNTNSGEKVYGNGYKASPPVVPMGQLVEREHT
jgi:hypothetical protein